MSCLARSLSWWESRVTDLKIFTIYPNERYPDFELHDGELFEDGEPCLAMTEADKAEFDAVVSAYNKWQTRIRRAADAWRSANSKAKP